MLNFLYPIKSELFVNEIAPRPHNSGHLTIEACNISQFDAHIRGVCNLPMPGIEQFKPAIMVNVLGQHLKNARTEVFHHIDWHFHDYGKDEVKKNRKMGHITILTDDIEVSENEIKHNPIWNI